VAIRRDAGETPKGIRIQVCATDTSKIASRIVVKLEVGGPLEATRERVRIVRGGEGRSRG
jgi:hypothetical protein